MQSTRLMQMRSAMTRTAATAAAVVALVLAGCGDREGSAAEEPMPKKNGIATGTAAGARQAAAPAVDARAQLQTISKAIPVYAGAQYRDDLTRRDTVTFRNQYGQNAEVYTLATDDSYPQVYHYYTTYLAQFRAYPPQVPYPPEQQNWRTMEVQLNQAMQDPFIPGDVIAPSGKQVTLQITETEAEPHTVIRYIVTPQPVQTAPVAAAQ
jgi:hypothetical protein